MVNAILVSETLIGFTIMFAEEKVDNMPSSLPDHRGRSMNFNRCSNGKGTSSLQSSHSINFDNAYTANSCNTKVGMMAKSRYMNLVFFTCFQYCSAKWNCNFFLIYFDRNCSTYSSSIFRFLNL